MSHSSSLGVEFLERRQLLSSTYTVHNLVSDGAVHAEFIDKNLVNPWGLVVGPFGVRVADNGSSSSTQYRLPYRGATCTSRGSKGPQQRMRPLPAAQSPLRPRAQPRARTREGTAWSLRLP